MKCSRDSYTKYRVLLEGESGAVVIEEMVPACRDATEIDNFMELVCRALRGYGYDSETIQLVFKEAAEHEHG